MCKIFSSLSFFNVEAIVTFLSCFFLIFKRIKIEYILYASGFDWCHNLCLPQLVFGLMTNMVMDWPAARSWLLEEHVSIAFLLQFSTCGIFKTSSNQFESWPAGSWSHTSTCYVVLYLSLIWETVGADDAFVKLHRSFGVSGFVFVPEVHIEQAKPLRVAFIPFKLIQEGPGRVAPHVDAIFDC